MGTAPPRRAAPDPPDPPTREPNPHPSWPAPPTPSVPSVQIDGFDELQPIGRGGFSYVFSARQRDFNRRVALKVLSFGLADERERRSFERECRAMGLVSQHPHIVTVFNAAFTTTKQPCIVMELYSGGTLGERLRSGRAACPSPMVLDVGVKIAGALQTAHDRGLLHRDIKPQNLFISEFGEPALGDFGISTLDDERSISGGGGLTVHYAPPEVLEGAPATPISDVYSFAATLYTLLEGTRPFAPPAGQRQSVGELARRIMLEEPPRVRPRRRARGRWPTLLARTMAKRPERAPAVGGRARPGAAAGAGRARARRSRRCRWRTAAARARRARRRRRARASAARARRRPAGAAVPPAPSVAAPARRRRRPTPSRRWSRSAPVGDPAPADDDEHDDHGHTVTVARAPGRPEDTTSPSRGRARHDAARRPRHRRRPSCASWPSPCRCSCSAARTPPRPTTPRRPSTSQLVDIRRRRRRRDVPRRRERPGRGGLAGGRRPAR